MSHIIWKHWNMLLIVQELTWSLVGNINYFNETQSQPLTSLMESLNYTQIVTEPTFVSAGSLLDHVYIRPSFMQILNSSVLSIYYC